MQMLSTEKATGGKVSAGDAEGRQQQERGEAAVAAAALLAEPGGSSEQQQPAPQDGDSGISSGSSAGGRSVHTGIFFNFTGPDGKIEQLEVLDEPVPEVHCTSHKPYTAAGMAGISEAASLLCSSDPPESVLPV